MDKVGGSLAIGTDGHGEVVIDLGRDLTGHIKFSPKQAGDLAQILMKKAMEANEERMQMNAVSVTPGLPG